MPRGAWRTTHTLGEGGPLLVVVVALEGGHGEQPGDSGPGRQRGAAQDGVDREGAGRHADELRAEHRGRGLAKVGGGGECGAKAGTRKQQAKGCRLVKAEWR